MPKLTKRANRYGLKDGPTLIIEKLCFKKDTVTDSSDLYDTHPQ